MVVNRWKCRMNWFLVSVVSLSRSCDVHAQKMDKIESPTIYQKISFLALAVMFDLASHWLVAVCTSVNYLVPHPTTWLVHTTFFSLAVFSC